MKLAPDNLLSWIALGTAVVTAIGGGYAIWDSVATKTYHDRSLQPMQKSIENIEASAVVQRIRGLLRSRCAGGGFPIELQALLQEQLQRYEELTGREFRQGTCQDGKWITASGVPG